MTKPSLYNVTFFLLGPLLLIKFKVFTITEIKVSTNKTLYI